MTSLVERLRAHVYTRSPDRSQVANPAWCMMLDAADDLERLQHEVKREKQIRNESIQAVAFCFAVAAVVILFTDRK